MRKIKSYSVKDFMRGDYKNRGKKNKKLYLTVLTATGVYLTVALPKGVLAASSVAGGDVSFDTIYESVMRLFDGAVVVMIVFCCCMWGLGGNRGQAIERLIAVGSSYILAKHARDIQQWLAGM